MIRKTMLMLVPALALFACDSNTAPLEPQNPDIVAQMSNAGGRAATTGTIFVTSQGLYYDTFVVVDPLPPTGKFQLLVNGTTEFGPGDQGYVGGRWWEDTNGNGIQDATDHYFLCPLLPPGRPTP